MSFGAFGYYSRVFDWIRTDANDLFSVLCPRKISPERKGWTPLEANEGRNLLRGLTVQAVGVIFVFVFVMSDQEQVPGAS